jgi:nucleoside-diphosphate-sugar epimerase
MKIILTGGTGLIGTDICKALIKAGHTVYATSRKVQKSTDVHLKWIATDFNNFHPSIFDTIKEQVDVLIHNAGAIETATIDNLASIRKVNIDFTSELFDWAIQKNIKTILYISSFSTLQKPFPALITEQSTLAPITMYSMSKHWGEVLLNEYSKHHSFRKLIIRVSSPICFDFNRLHNNVVKKMMRAGIDKNPIKVFGKGNREQNFIATTDIAEAIIRALENINAEGVFNVASDSPITMENLAMLIANKFSVPVKFEGDDILENEQWNISTTRAKELFGFNPIFGTSEEVIKNLLTNFTNENRNIK